MEKEIRTNILIEYDNYTETVNVTYRFLKEMEKNYPVKVKCANSIMINIQLIEWCDIFFSIRSTNQITAHISTICQKYHRFFIYFLDDNLFMHKNEEFFKKIRVKYLQRTIENADVFVSTSTFLNAFVSGKCNIHRFVKTDTAVREEEIHVWNTNENSIFKIVFYSNSGDELWFSNILMPILPELIERTNKHIEIQLLGINNIGEHHGKYKIKYVPHMSLGEFKQYLWKQNFDIGVAPLPDNDDFCKCKYFNKFMEFTMAGIPGVYSNCPPYTSVVENGKNGFLCNNDKEEWLNTIQSLMEDKILRQSIVGNAQDLLRTSYSYENIEKRIIKDIPELITYKATKKVQGCLLVVKLNYIILLFLDKVNAVYRYLQMGGVRAFLKRTKEFVTIMIQRKSNK